ncbi:hypothetical protein COLO4_09881 [Corchorus olitorius]|uniref:Uncharacterized protein n=1 Tax=Corchorus olitorius TaxID=93759 RepID=A0A1R3KAQ3_9ROSI|nr:hypothetical protein COLO4_09881 [Corchorus olitorius]
MAPKSTAPKMMAPKFMSPKVFTTLKVVMKR